MVFMNAVVGTNRDPPTNQEKISSNEEEYEREKERKKERKR